MIDKDILAGLIQNEERSEAIRKLLKLPDLPCLRTEKGLKRGYRYTQSRSSTKDFEKMKFELGTAYVQWRKQILGNDISTVVSLRRQPKFRVVRSA